MTIKKTKERKIYLLGATKNWYKSLKKHVGSYCHDLADFGKSKKHKMEEKEGKQYVQFIAYNNKNLIKIIQ